MGHCVVSFFLQLWRFFPLNFGAWSSVLIREQGNALGHLQWMSWGSPETQLFLCLLLLFTMKMSLWVWSWSSLVAHKMKSCSKGKASQGKVLEIQKTSLTWHISLEAALSRGTGVSLYWEITTNVIILDTGNELWGQRKRSDFNLWTVDRIRICLSHMYSPPCSMFIVDEQLCCPPSLTAPGRRLSRSDIACKMNCWQVIRLSSVA